jgi:hypothetical protein
MGTVALEGTGRPSVQQQQHQHPVNDADGNKRRLAAAAAVRWQPGDVVDVDTEDGMEFGAIVVGPSVSGNAGELSIRFADGVVDDWPVDEFRSRLATVSDEPVAQSSQVPADTGSSEQPNNATGTTVSSPNEAVILKPALSWLGGNDDIGGAYCRRVPQTILPECDTEATLVVHWQVPHGFSTSRFRVGFKHSGWWTWAYEDCDPDNTPSCSRVANDDNGLCGMIVG